MASTSSNLLVAANQKAQLSPQEGVNPEALLIRQGIKDPVVRELAQSVHTYPANPFWTVVPQSALPVTAAEIETRLPAAINQMVAYAGKYNVILDATQLSDCVQVIANPDGSLQRVNFHLPPGKAGETLAGFLKAGTYKAGPDATPLLLMLEFNENQATGLANASFAVAADDARNVQFAKAQALLLFQKKGYDEAQLKELDASLQGLTSVQQQNNMMMLAYGNTTVYMGDGTLRLSDTNDASATAKAVKLYTAQFSADTKFKVAYQETGTPSLQHQKDFLNMCREIGVRNLDEATRAEFDRLKTLENTVGIGMAAEVTETAPKRNYFASKRGIAPTEHVFEPVAAN